MRATPAIITSSRCQRLTSFLVLLVTLAGLPQTLLAQMHLAGTIATDLRAGTVHCDVFFSNLPPGKNYTLVLNKAFTVKYFKLAGKLLRYVDTKEVNGNTGYLLYADKEQQQPLVSWEQLEVVYTAAFPTYAPGELTYSDDMGVIAIRDGILRATSQSVFVPALVETSTNAYTDQYTYDLTVKSACPASVYVNGSVPQRGRTVHVVAALPYSFLLYMGDYAITKRQQLYLLNSKLPAPYVTVLAHNIEKIRTLYSQMTGVTYDQNIVLAQIFSIGPPDQYPAWAFTVTPTIVFDLNGLTNKISLPADTLELGLFQMLAHEMGHKYTGGGTVTKNLWHFYSESFAQYLSWQAVAHVRGEADLRKLWERYSFNARQLQRDYVPFYEIEQTTQTITNSSYDYYPLYLVAYAKLFGEDKCNALLRQIAADKTRFPLDNEYLKRCALETGLSEQAWATYSTTFLEAKNCLPALRTLVNAKP